MASHQVARFGGHRHGGSGDTIILGSHVISQDPAIEESCHFIRRSP